MEGNEDKFLDADTNNEMMLNPAKYILKVDTNSDPGAIDDFCDDIQYLDEKYAILIGPRNFFVSVSFSFDFSRFVTAFVLYSILRYKYFTLVSARKEIAPDNVEPLYEELKKIYDWNEDETKVKPRIKGDQRTYQESYDKVDPIDRVAGEPFKDQVEPPQVHDDSTKKFGKRC